MRGVPETVIIPDPPDLPPGYADGEYADQTKPVTEQAEDDPMDPFMGGVSAGMEGCDPRICPYGKMTREWSEWQRGQRWGVAAASEQAEDDVEF